MVNLSTVYIVSILLTSLAGMGSAFIGNKIYPIRGGSSIEPPKAENQSEVIEDTLKPEEKTLKDKIIQRFQVDDDVAQYITEFIETPVIDWEKIASTPSELRQKFIKTMTHPDRNQCPPDLLELCKIVYVKYSNMTSFIKGDPTYTTYGDQTSEALSLLSNTE